MLLQRAEACALLPAGLGTGLRAELLGTAAGDPLLQGLPSIAPRQIIPSASFAARLDLQPGMQVTLRAIRGDTSAREVLNLPVTVVAIAPPSASISLTRCPLPIPPMEGLHDI